MDDFFSKFLALILTGVVLTFLIPFLVQMFFSLGPIGFLIAIVAFCAWGAWLENR
jgi:hypothetical protein